MDPLIPALVAGITFGVFALYVGNGVVQAQKTSSQRLVALRPTREEALQTAFSERAVAPVIQKVGRLVMRFTPVGWNQKTGKRLKIAGWYPRIDAASWASVRVISIVGAIIVFLLIQGAVGSQRLLLAVFIGIAGVLGPEAILSRTINDRKAVIEKDLPDIIDLLVISVEAGLGFESALGRVAQNVPGQLADEFSRMLQETRVGVSRHQAMKDLSERTDVEDLNSFILSMNQADAFGVSIARMLRVQADELRVRRRQRAQERAFAAPVKMTFPLVLCIFPSIFVVLLGPAVISIVRGFAET
ncbi:bacterial type II secretion system protein F domain protein [bacterium BMS3Bbin02]|nr:bacterial type II secretion system protein F domain protein [bacterium BMS3Bbin02]